MAKKKLIDEIRADPARYYRMPADVIRDRRFSDEERMEILSAWERDARAQLGTAGDEPNALKQVLEALGEVEKKIPGGKQSDGQ